MASRPQLNQSEVGRVDATGRVVLGRWLYDFLVALSPNPAPAVLSPTPGASPWTYTNTSGYPADAMLYGGTVSAVALVRGGVTTTIGTASPAALRLAPGDGLRVTYTVAPTVRIIPG